MNQNVYKNEKRIKQLFLQRQSNTRPSSQVKLTFAEAKHNVISFTGLAESPDLKKHKQNEQMLTREHSWRNFQGGFLEY